MRVKWLGIGVPMGHPPIGRKFVARMLFAYNSLIGILSTQVVASTLHLLVLYPFRLPTPHPGNWGWLWHFIQWFWRSIPTYLTFYLLVIVVVYATFKGRRRVTVISPFHLPSGNQLPFGEDTVANALRDAFVEIHKKAGEGAKHDSKNPTGLMMPKLEGIKFSAASSFEVPTRFAVEVKGLSHEAIVSFARKVLGKEWVVSGDVVGDTSGFHLLARNGTDLWSSSSNAATIDGLRKACGEVALRMLGTIDTTLLSAYATLRASELIREDKLEESLELMKEAASLLPSNALIVYDLGVAHAKRGENSQAIAAFKKALELNKDFPEALNNLGVALAKEQKYGEAIATYERALGIRPEYPAALYNLGDALQEDGRPAEAIEKYQRALEIEPRDPDIHFNLGLAFYLNKQYAESINAYREADKIQPGDADILHNLGISLFKDGKRSEAISVVRRASEIRPNDHEIRKTLDKMLRAVEQDRAV